MISLDAVATTRSHTTARHFLLELVAFTAYFVMPACSVLKCEEPENSLPNLKEVGSNFH